VRFSTPYGNVVKLGHPHKLSLVIKVRFPSPSGIAVNLGHHIK
jgi:hypothetical protein